MAFWFVVIVKVCTAGVLVLCKTVMVSFPHIVKVVIICYGFHLGSFHGSWISRLQIHQVVIIKRLFLDLCHELLSKKGKWATNFSLPDHPAVVEFVEATSQNFQQSTTGFTQDYSVSCVS